MTKDEAVALAANLNGAREGGAMNFFEAVAKHFNRPDSTWSVVEKLQLETGGTKPLRLIHSRDAANAKR